MKIYTLLLSFFIASGSFSQGGATLDLERRIDALELNNKMNINRLHQLEIENLLLLKKLDSIENNTSNQISRAQELQSQNERAMNLALDAFTLKFNEQNKTVENVQNRLNKGFVNQLIVLILAVIILLIIFIFAVRFSTNKALKSNVASWNSFQEYVLKK